MTPCSSSFFLLLSSLVVDSTTSLVANSMASSCFFSLLLSRLLCTPGVFGLFYYHPDSLGCSTITLPWYGTFLIFLSLPRITQAQLYCPESLRPSSLYALVLYLFDPSIHSSSSTSSRYPSQFKFPHCVGFHVSFFLLLLNRSPLTIGALAVFFFFYLGILSRTLLWRCSSQSFATLINVDFSDSLLHFALQPLVDHLVVFIL